MQRSISCTEDSSDQLYSISIIETILAPFLPLTGTAACNLGQFIWLFWQISIVILTNTFGYFNKDILQYGTILALHLRFTGPLDWTEREEGEKEDRWEKERDSGQMHLAI